MKRVFLLFVGLILMSCQLYAQKGNGIVFNKFEYRKGVDRSKAVIIGLKGGIALPRLHYSDASLNALAKQTVIKAEGGLFVQVPLPYDISIGADLLMASKGGVINYNYKGDSNYPVKYVIDYKCFDFRIPVTYHFYVTDEFRPYVFVAPALSSRLGGTITLEQKHYYEIDQDLNLTVDVGNANMQMFEFSTVFGAGLRYDFNFTSFSLVTKLDVAYVLGITNTFSKKEINDDFGNDPVNSNILNVNAYNPSGNRHNRGFEVMLSIGLPLKFIDRGCSNFTSGKERIY